MYIRETKQVRRSWIEIFESNLVLILVARRLNVVGIPVSRHKVHAQSLCVKIFRKVLRLTNWTATTCGKTVDENKQIRFQICNSLVKRRIESCQIILIDKQLSLFEKEA